MSWDRYQEDNRPIEMFLFFYFYILYFELIFIVHICKAGQGKEKIVGVIQYLPYRLVFYSRFSVAHTVLLVFCCFFFFLCFRGLIGPPSCFFTPSPCKELESEDSFEACS